ncbi:hypothetical protein [Thermoactinospora rubra]|uniref:hypothetical protein n=1 Tax=Thermoactinospora rubra TaxID=1088767 RepID=UPI00130207D1|nr:hypothetical protein [Thermoactinospora rubra]
MTMNACPHGLANPGMCPDCRRQARQQPHPGAPVHRATDVLIALALAVRPDWPEPDVRAALAAAHTVGMTWEQALVGLVRLMVDGHATPRELIPPHHRIARHVDPEAVRASASRGVELARHLLEERDPP